MVRCAWWRNVPKRQARLGEDDFDSQTAVCVEMVDLAVEQLNQIIYSLEKGIDGPA